jgi:hypothetical protein
MKCSEFRDQHCLFVDDTLAGVELVRMQQHISVCNACAALDAKIRRALMVARSLPAIQPSPDFAARLESKLKRCREEPESTACANFKAVAGIGAVASLVMLGYVVASLDKFGKQEDIVLPPVVAMARPPELETLAPVAPAIVASVSAGMPIWPAALFAEQAPLHLANLRESRQ